MKCVICRAGKTQFGKATVTLQRDDTTVVIKGNYVELDTLLAEWQMRQLSQRNRGATGDLFASVRAGHGQQAARGTHNVSFLRPWCQIRHSRHAEVEILRFAA